MVCIKQSRCPSANRVACGASYPPSRVTKGICMSCMLHCCLFCVGFSGFGCPLCVRRERSACPLVQRGAESLQAPRSNPALPPNPQPPPPPPPRQQSGQQGRLRDDASVAVTGVTTRWSCRRSGLTLTLMSSQ